MFSNIEDIHNAGKENIECTLTCLGALSKGVQAVASQAADYTKKNLEDVSSTVENLMSAKTVDKAVTVQNDYARTAYENYIGQMTRISELTLEATRDTYKPFEGFFKTAIKQGTGQKSRAK